MFRIIKQIKISRGSLRSNDSWVFSSELHYGTFCSLHRTIVVSASVWTSQSDTGQRSARPKDVSVAEDMKIHDDANAARTSATKGRLCGWEPSSRVDLRRTTKGRVWGGNVGCVYLCGSGDWVRGFHFCGPPPCEEKQDVRHFRHLRDVGAILLIRVVPPAPPPTLLINSCTHLLHTKTGPTGLVMADTCQEVCLDFKSSDLFLKKKKKTQTETRPTWLTAVCLLQTTPSAKFNYKQTQPEAAKSVWTRFRAVHTNSGLLKETHKTLGPQ